MEISDSLSDLAHAIRDSVRPHLGLLSSRESVGKASSGDESFAIDEVAERAIVDFIETRGISVAYYSEDRGIVEFGDPKEVLIVDPIDGSRPAMAGFEQCVVSIALAPYAVGARLADVSFGCILDIKNDRMYTATRDSVRIVDKGAEVPVTLSPERDLGRMAWSVEIAGRPADLVFGSVATLVDKSSIRGGFFVYSSTAFSLTRLVTGQLNAVVDVGNRILKDYPGSREKFLEAGLGTVMGLFPYDIAAAVLIARTAGCVVTDAYGRDICSMRLLDTSEANIQSIAAASNPWLHEALLKEIDQGVRSLA
ncbi:MAG: hypothetical protein KBC96_12625 [Armatimonadetes bacterium]|nr:hypothetical protein [Armatimonadota bacterium]